MVAHFMHLKLFLDDMRKKRKIGLQYQEENARNKAGFRTAVPEKYRNQNSWLDRDLDESLFRLFFWWTMLRCQPESMFLCSWEDDDKANCNQQSILWRAAFINFIISLKRHRNERIVGYLPKGLVHLLLLMGLNASCQHKQSFLNSGDSLTQLYFLGSLQLWQVCEFSCGVS